MSPTLLLPLVVGTIVPAGVICWLSCFLVRRQAERWKLLDRPGGHKGHALPVPLGGGLAIAAGVLATFLAATLILWSVEHGWLDARFLSDDVAAHIDGLLSRWDELWFLLLSASTLMVVGLVDDLRGVDWRIRLSVQLVVAIVSVLGQGWRLTLFIDWSWLTAAMSVVWIVALVNAFNMLDNMDGLSAGVATIACISLAAGLLMGGGNGVEPQLFVAGFLLVLAGSLLGFLWHNRPPARLYMGDAGSYFVGYSLAVATLVGQYTRYDGLRPHAVLFPLCVMAVPLYDLISVVWIRLREGRSVFQGDTRHFSHRLVALGLSRPQAVMVICLVSAMCSVAGLLLTRVGPATAVAIGLCVLALLLLVARLESRSKS